MKRGARVSDDENGSAFANRRCILELKCSPVPDVYSKDRDIPYVVTVQDGRLITLLNAAIKRDIHFRSAFHNVVGSHDLGGSRVRA